MRELSFLEISDQYFLCKVACVFAMVISSKFRIWQHRKDDHQEDAPHFSNGPALLEKRLELCILSFSVHDPTQTKLRPNYKLAELTKLGCVFAMVIWSEFRMGQYRDRDHREDAPDFTIMTRILSYGEIQ